MGAYNVKYCKRCGETKLKSNFNLNSTNKDGLQYWCKVCQKTVKNLKRMSLRETIRTRNCLECCESFPYLSRKKVFCSNRCKSKHFEKTKTRRDWTNNNLDRKMLYRAKASAKKKGIDFNLDLGDINIPSKCPVLGLVLNTNVGKGYHEDSPSLDRINSNLGYIKGNVRVVSARANLLKSNATLEELEKILEDAKKIQIQQS